MLSSEDIQNLYYMRLNKSLYLISIKAVTNEIKNCPKYVTINIQAASHDSLDGYIEQFQA